MARAGAKRKREKVRSMRIRKDDNVMVIGVM